MFRFIAVPLPFQASDVFGVRSLACFSAVICLSLSSGHKFGHTGTNGQPFRYGHPLVSACGRAGTCRPPDCHDENTVQGSGKKRIF